MDKTLKLTNLNCEQVYNIWATEPQLIQLLDLRDAAEFAKAHIPGAKSVRPDRIFEEMDILGPKLAVIIAPPKIENSLRVLLNGRSDFVFMTDCHQWSELNHPVVASGKREETLKHLVERGRTMGTDIIFYQLFESVSSTYTYIIADKKTKEAAIIDPVLETVDRDLKLIEELGLRLMYVLDTHIHADHITGAGEIRKRTGTKSGVSTKANVNCVDIPLEDGQELMMGEKVIKVIATPGHTDTCLSYYFEGMVFTGDALLIRGTGRTDFQQGSAENLYHSVNDKLFRLPDETIVYPGHDYRGQTHSTIELEKKFNPRLGGGKTKEEFKKIMSELKLADPKKIHEAVPANLACGLPKDQKLIQPRMVQGIPEISSEEVLKVLDQARDGKLRLVDVRRADEFNNELGHIPGAELVTLGEPLTEFLKNGNRKEEMIFVCRSGARSEQATLESLKLGYKSTANMVGGMLQWNHLRLPTEK